MQGNVSRSQLWITELVIVVLAALFFVPGLGMVHLFDWDEINFAESAREMLLTGDLLNVQVNFESFWEKPPLFIWMQALSMHLFGVNEFAARFPNAICGIITLVVLFRIGYNLKGYRMGILWSAFYACSFFTFFYFKTGIIDPWLNLFIFLGTYFFVLFTSPLNRRNKNWQVLWSALFLGLAILTKGPVGFLIFLLTFCCYLVAVRFRLSFRWYQVVLFFVILCLVGGLWFILQILSGNLTVIQDFIVYQIRLFQTQDAGHGGFFLYHFVMVLIGLFPAVWFALPVFKPSIYRSENDRNGMHMMRWMMLLFWVVMVLFTIVRTKIVHYSSMSYFPLTFMAAWYADSILSHKQKLYTWQKVMIAVMGIIYGVAIIGVVYFDNFKHLILPYVDEFTAGNLQAYASWMGWEVAIGIWLLVCIILFLVWSKHFEGRAISILLLGCLGFVFSAMCLIVPQVEKYSQAAMIEFLEERQGEDCYIYPIHKSYAHYFYADRQPENSESDKYVLMQGAIDKPVYFILRNTTKEVTQFTTESPESEFIYNKHGFAFYKRNPVEQVAQEDGQTDINE